MGFSPIRAHHRFGGELVAAVRGQQELVEALSVTPCTVCMLNMSRSPMRYPAVSQRPPSLRWRRPDRWRGCRSTIWRRCVVGRVGAVAAKAVDIALQVGPQALMEAVRAFEHGQPPVSSGQSMSGIHRGVIRWVPRDM